MKYTPQLDGIRAIAVALVLVAHFGPAQTAGAGLVGVDLFFVLSGFLITSILYGQWLQSGRISLLPFYGRRALRLWPAAWLLIALYVLAAPLIGAPHDHYRAAVAMFFSYMNWYRGPQGFIGHAWSLSIEEQFYVGWPTLLVILLHKSRRAVIATLGTLLAVAITWRVFLAFHGASADRIYSGTDTHADPLLLGCLLAVTTLPAFLKEWLSKSWIVPAMLMLALVPLTAWSIRRFVWEIALTGILGAWLIVAATGSADWLAAKLSLRPMVWLGRRSYGVYLWHVPILKVLMLFQLRLVARGVIGISLSLLIAGLSYRLVEEPFLRRKAKLPIGSCRIEELPHGCINTTATA